MPLTVEQHPCWLATCDGCEEGDNSEYGGSFHYSTEAEARQALSGSDWIELAGGVWLCLDCWEAERAKLPCPHGGRCTGACGDDCPPVAVAPRDSLLPKED